MTQKALDLLWALFLGLWRSRQRPYAVLRVLRWSLLTRKCPHNKLIISLVWCSDVAHVRKICTHHSFAESYRGFVPPRGKNMLFVVKKEALTRKHDALAPIDNR